MKKMNKKGFAIPLWLILVVLAIIFLLGAGSTLKIISLLKSVPNWVWFITAIVIILMLTGGKRK